jgi:hypothetical protein
VVQHEQRIEEILLHILILSFAAAYLRMVAWLECGPDVLQSNGSVVILIDFRKSLFDNQSALCIHLALQHK